MTRLTKYTAILLGGLVGRSVVRAIIKKTEKK